MADKSFDDLSNITDVAGLCYSPGENVALSRITTELMREVTMENQLPFEDRDLETATTVTMESQPGSSTPKPSRKIKEGTRVARKLKKMSLKGKRPRQDHLKLCTICSKKYANMRQHLTKTHQLSKKHHNFLLSYHRTEICTSTVYQCNTCCLRFTGKKKHKITCKNPSIIRVRADSKEEFPADLKEFVPTPSGNIRQVHDLIDEYDKNRIECGDQPLTRFQKNFLIRVVDDTKFFRKALHLKVTYQRVKEQKNYTHQTMRKFLFELARLVEYSKCYKMKEYRFNAGMITGELKTLLRSSAKKASKEVNTRMIKRFDKVPSLYQVAHLRKMVKELLNDHPQEAFSYTEYLSLLVFLVHSESNCRIGALLDLTKAQFEEMKTKKVITTFEHKTGSNFPNFIRITEENRKWIDDLHAKFVEEQEIGEPKLTFPSPTNKKFTCQAKYLKETIQRFFAIEDKHYNPDNIRKAWDSYRTKTNFVEGTDAILYQLNTGHSEATRNKYYLKPASEDEISKFLDKQLALIEDPENCYVTEDDPPPVMPDVEDSRDDVPEQENPVLEDTSERCTEKEHVGDAVTPDTPHVEETEDSDKENSAEDDESDPNDEPFPQEEEYKPLSKRKKVTAKEEPVDTMEERQKRWSEIRLKLLKFKGPEDPLRPKLIALFDEVCKNMRYHTRDELRKICKDLGATEREANILAEKAVKKLCNVMKVMKH